MKLWLTDDGKDETDVSPGIPHAIVTIIALLMAWVFLWILSGGNTIEVPR